MHNYRQFLDDSESFNFVGPVVLEIKRPRTDADRIPDLLCIWAAISESTSRRHAGRGRLEAQKKTIIYEHET